MRDQEPIINGNQRTEGPWYRAALFLVCLVSLPAYPQQQYTMRDFLSLSIEALSKIKISSVSKQEESLSGAPASIYVITQDEIRRSGATTIPEALRLAPNLHVARGDAGQYAISARGFNSALENKLLVLIDGRTIYSPFFAGVFWITQDLLMEDIERIEVISGPGGTLWGLNAVNGVINIITKSSGSTQGTLLTAHSGTLERGVGVRHGGTIGETGHYRVYAKALDVDHTDQVDGTPVPDAFDRARLGFRADWFNNGSQFTLQGDTYNGTSDQRAPGETDFSGTNMLARYTHPFKNGSELQLQGYYDLAVRDEEGAYKDEMEIYDLEFQYALPVLRSNRILFGGGHRVADDRTSNYNPFILFLPENKDLKWSNIFVQDEVSLTRDLDLTLGAKWESNVYTGTEFLPNVRLAWRPASDNRLLWGEVSRAVRAPARLDRDFYIPLFGINGGPDFQSEISDVAEIGWRAQPTSAFSYSLTAFYHDHDKQRSGEPNPNGPGFVVSNTIEGTTKGLEGWANYQVTPDLRLSGGFIELRQDLRNKPGSLDPTGPSALGNDPEHILTFRSTFNVNENQQLYVMIRYVSELPEPRVPSYTAVDAHYGWRLSDNLELSLTVQNLANNGHTEFGDPATASEYQREAFLKIVWID